MTRLNDLEFNIERKIKSLDKLRQYVTNWGDPTASCFNPNHSYDGFDPNYGLCSNTNRFGMTSIEYSECVGSWTGFYINDSKSYPIEGNRADYYYDRNRWGFKGATVNSERRLDFAKHMIKCLEVMIEDLRKGL